MRPRRVATSNSVFRLAGGNEDNDLFVERRPEDGTLTSVWELDEVERAAVAAGGTIELTVWGDGTPPVALRVGQSLADRRR